ncbi:MAG TPA: folylpolyglutamate synthase/dihydrofolate synthase family protein [Pyrinomonadaceae bacterium]|nr:folylpolyglutamate synthase/dihydrofolate synthase family protein [Pyrinomonadaceae bacterium]
MNFEAAVQYLLSLGHETLTMKLGLRNTELLLAALDHPERAFPSVQIAGTNGKGSTATMLDSICRTASIKCGLYTSPHLVSITERIKVAGQSITTDEFAACATVVGDVSKQLLHDKQIEALPTFFEQLTAIALLAFRNARIELAILETGLGGRLDSTTAANARIVGITQIALDHQEYLGHTIESIAAEKAAIIRPGVRAVIAKQQLEAMAVLLRRCDETGVTPVIDDRSHAITNTTADGRYCFSFEALPEICVGLRGRHQIDNAAVAIRLADALNLEGFNIPSSAIVDGIANTEHAGRLELIPHRPAFLLDGAHNVAGCESLRDYLDAFAPRPLTLVFGAMRDKQLDQIGERLFPVADLLILTAIENPRSASIELLQTIASRYAGGMVIENASSTEALRVAREKTPPYGLICVAGSLYLIGEVRPTILSLEKQDEYATQRTAADSQQPENF